MEDDNIFNEGVWYEEVVFIFNWTIEWISERQFVNISVAMSNTSAVDLVVGDILLKWGVRADVDVELEDLASNFASWEVEASWESIVSFRHVKVEFFFTLVGGHDVLVEVSVAGAVLDGSTFVAVALDHGLAGFQGVDEFVQFNEVYSEKKRITIS